MLSRSTFSILAAIVFAGPSLSAEAAIVPAGDVSPSDPSTWTSSTTGYIGYTSSGAVTVDDGSDLISQIGYLGYGSGAFGLVAVSGSGSTWVNSSGLYIGMSGTGELDINDGGSVRDASGYIGYNSGSSGTVSVDGAGSIWTNTGNLFVG